MIDKDIRVVVPTDHAKFEIEIYINDPSVPDGIRKLDLGLLNQTRGVTYLPLRNSLLVDSKELNNQFAQINVSGNIDSELLDINKGVIVKLKTVNNDHYRYHLTSAKESETEYAPLFEPVINFTNIENGIGLFSAFSATRDTLDFSF